MHVPAVLTKEVVPRLLLLLFDMTTMAQALCNKRGTTVPELHRIMEMLLVVTDRDWDQFKRGEVKKCLVMKPEDWKPPPRWEGPRFPERI